MRKKAFYFIALAVCLAGCNKNAEEQRSGYWKVGHIVRSNSVAFEDTLKTYYATATTLNGNTFMAMDSRNSIRYHFPGTTPPIAGMYKVVGGTPRSGEVSFSIVDSRVQEEYSSTGINPGRVTVAIEDGRLKVVMSDAWVKSKDVVMDSVLVSAHLLQSAPL